MILSYNTTRYKEFLKKSSILISEDKRLRDEFPEKDKELSYYQLVLLGQINYNRKDFYIDLIKKYLTDERSFNSFTYEFFKMFEIDNKTVEEIEKNSQLLSNISIDSNSAEFNQVIEDISDICILSDYPFEPEQIDIISESDLKIFIKENLLKIFDF